MKTKTHIPFGHCALPALIAALCSGSAMAQSAKREEPKPTFWVSGGVSYGVGIRLQESDPLLVMNQNAAVAGAVSSTTMGRNQDDGNLNYRKGDVFTNAVTGFADLNFQQGPVSGLIRLQGWHDAELKDGAVPFGHVPNGYQANQPLSDASARSRGKFSNVVLSTAVIRGKTSVADMPLLITGGNQNIGWRGYGLAAGPMAAIDPVDVPSINRQGGFPETRAIPFPALRAALEVSKTTKVDAYYQLGFEASQLPLCGTFFSRTDIYGADGCQQMMNNNPANVNRNDGQQLATPGNTTFVAAGAKPSSSGQFGISTRWSPEPQTELALSYARYHSRNSFINMRKSSPTTSAGITEYPKGVQVFAIEGKRNFQPVTVYGSVGYSPNRPLGYVIAEVAQAFGSTTARSVFRPGVDAAIAAGEWFNGWDRRKTSDWQLGVTRQLKDALGASSLNLQGEMNARFVHNLPDPSQLRYVRPDVFGTGPVTGFPNGGCGPQIGCTNEGYLTRSAWSYTLQATALYPNAVGPVTLRPRVAVTHDVKGYSADNLIKEGRVRLALGLDAIYDKTTTVSFNVVGDVKSSDYDNGRDRGYASLSLSKRF